MNIGIFTDTYYPHVNGVATSIKMLKDEMQKRGHKVYIFTTSNPMMKESRPDVFRLPSMPFVFLPTYRIAFFYSPKLLLKMKKFNLDVIHTQTEFSIGIFGKIVSEFLKIPMVHTYHTMYEDYVHYIAKGHLISPKMAQKFSRIFCNRAKIVIAPTEKTKDSLKSYGVIRPIEIIPTGITLEKFSNEIASEIIDAKKKELGINKNDFVILFLGRLAKEKSIDVLISQMPNILQKIPKAKLLIVGGGPYFDILKNLANQLHVPAIFTSEIEWQNINLFYKLANVFASASTSETQGLTYIEAMASKIVVVAKNDASIKNLITHQKNGYVFNNPDELADILLQIKNNPQNQIIDAASKTIQNLSAEKFACAVENIYQKVL